jgi:hypothetical protein
MQRRGPAASAATRDPNRNWTFQRGRFWIERPPPKRKRRLAGTRTANFESTINARNHNRVAGEAEARLRTRAVAAALFTRRTP